MSEKKRTSEQILAPQFHFRVDVDEVKRRVTLWDGGDAYTFIFRNNEPFVTARPGERDMSNEKWRALIAQAGAILKRLHEQTPA